MDYLSQLPVEVNFIIRKHLCLTDIYNLSLANKIQAYYTKQDFVNLYCGTIYTGYYLCLYSDPIVEPIAKLLLPLLNFPLVTRYYKITITGHIMYNNTLGGRINVTMTQIENAIYDETVGEWPDDDVIDDIKSNHTQQPLYLDYWLSTFKDVNKAMIYDSTNSYNLTHKYKHKLVNDDEVWPILQNAAINTAMSNIQLCFDICYGNVTPVIYLNDICQTLFDTQIYNNIKIITDDKQYIKAVIFDHKFAPYDHSILIHEYHNNNYVKELWYTYHNRVLTRFSYEDTVCCINYDWNTGHDSTHVWAHYLPRDKEGYALTVSDKLKRKITLDDNTPYYDNCYCLLLSTQKQKHYKEFICPKIV